MNLADTREVFFLTFFVQGKKSQKLSKSVKNVFDDFRAAPIVRPLWVLWLILGERSHYWMAKGNLATTTHYAWHTLCAAVDTWFLGGKRSLRNLCGRIRLLGSFGRRKHHRNCLGIILGRRNSFRGTEGFLYLDFWRIGPLVADIENKWFPV